MRGEQGKGGHRFELNKNKTKRGGSGGELKLLRYKKQYKNKRNRGGSGGHFPRSLNYVS